MTMMPKLLLERGHEQQECSESGCPCHEWVRHSPEQPASEPDNDKWHYEQRQTRALVVNAIDQNVALGCGSSNAERLRRVKRITTEHNGYRRLREENERLREVLRRTLKAIEVIDFSACREGAYDSIPWAEIEAAVLNHAEQGEGS